MTTEMKRDIVERLRDCRTATESMPTYFVCGDAADEIERLRRAVDKMADAAGPAYTPRWVLDAPWRTNGDG